MGAAMARLAHGDRLRRIAWSAARLLPIVALGVAWELYARFGNVTPYMLPTLSSVFERIWDDALGGDLSINLGLTLYRALTGFAISAVGGMLLGVAMSRNVPVRWFFDPIVSVGFPMPKIAFLPVLILWLGLYDTTKIALVVFDAIFPVITATLAGLASVERELIWSARNM